MNLKKILNYFKVCLKDWSTFIGLFWGLSGAGSIFAIIDILFKYRNYLFFFYFFLLSFSDLFTFYHLY